MCASIQFLLLLLVLPFCMLVALIMAAPPSVAKPGCPEKCGNVTIPYPFGIDSNCAMPGFNLTCNQSLPYYYNVEVASISLLHGRVSMYNQISSLCYNHSTGKLVPHIWRLNLLYPYRLSYSQNKFTVIGCETFAYIWAKRSINDSFYSYRSGCLSSCSSIENLAGVSNCSGVGCCQTTISEDFPHYNVHFDEDYNTSGIWQFSPCSYAVLMDASSFKFHPQYVTTDSFMQEHTKRAPLAVDWAFNWTTNCVAAKVDDSSYACVAENSNCVDATGGPGYLCICSTGYTGNPYLDNGCIDIDECLHSNTYPCQGICLNTPGSYICSCPPGKYGNATGGNCYQNQILSLQMKLVIGIVSGLVFMLLASMLIYVQYERRSLNLLKQKYFQEHGGRLLLEEIEAQQGLQFKIFREEELKRATNNFDNDNVLGQGGHGTVYKGFLEDQTLVAIKKSKFIDEKQKKEFGKEMIILSRVNHKNIVKLLGCCLEVEIPMLVYEYIPKGNLFQLIHQRIYMSTVSWDNRLRIAYESADALAYLHATASPPIIHGDIKSPNILLDEQFTAKVSDFGASKLAPNNEFQFATLVQGTCGYLDPEYLQTCQLTDKSDVYSFGVVLAELFTGRNAIIFDGSEEKCLASVFVLALRNDRLLEIVDEQVKAEGEERLLQRIGELIGRCLSVIGEERPAMKEVAHELDNVRRLKQHPWLQNQEEETEILLNQSPSYHVEERCALNIESGR